MMRVIISCWSNIDLSMRERTQDEANLAANVGSFSSSYVPRITWRLLLKASLLLKGRPLLIEPFMWVELTPRHTCPFYHLSHRCVLHPTYGIRLNLRNPSEHA